MKPKWSSVLCILALGILLPAVFLATQSSASRPPQANPASSLENAYRQNNIGVALLDQFKYKEAAEAFVRALKIDPKLLLAHINLAIALYNIPELPGDQREAKNALTFAADAPQPHYN